MLALQLTPPSTLSLTSISIPTPSPIQHLVHVSATAPTKSELSWPETLARSSPIPCHDLVGTIVSLPTSGKTRFRIGDTVYGLVAFPRDGCAAEYAVAEPEELSFIPKSLSNVEAATIPLSALSAWQALFVHGNMKAGDQILVLGASGSVGVMAVQLAKAKGGTVTATCGARNFDFVKGLGADQTIDYRREDEFEGLFDLAIDCVGSTPRTKAWNRVREGGALISVACPMGDGEVPEGKRGSYFIVEPNGAQLDEIGALISTGKLTAVIDRVFALQDGADAFERLEKGHVKGKIVLRPPRTSEG